MLDGGRRRRRGPEGQNGRVSKNVSEIALFVVDSAPESGHAESVSIIAQAIIQFPAAGSYLSRRVSLRRAARIPRTQAPALFKEN